MAFVSFASYFYNVNKAAIKMLKFTCTLFSYIGLCMNAFLRETAKQDRVDYDEMNDAFRHFARNISRLLTTPQETEKGGTDLISTLERFNDALERIISEVLMSKYDAVKFGLRLATEDDYAFMDFDAEKFVATNKPFFQKHAPFDEQELYEILNTTRQYIRKIKTFPYPKLESLNKTSDSYYDDYRKDDYREYLQQAKWLGH